MTEEEKQEIINSLKNRKKKGLSKYATLILISVIFLIGVMASFNNSPISMEKFVLFLGEYKMIISIMIGSVGAGLAVKNYKGDKE